MSEVTSMHSLASKPFPNPQTIILNLDIPIINGLLSNILSPIPFLDGSPPHGDGFAINCLRHRAYRFGDSISTDVRQICEWFIELVVSVLRAALLGEWGCRDPCALVAPICGFVGCTLAIYVRGSGSALTRVKIPTVGIFKETFKEGFSILELVLILVIHKSDSLDIRHIIAIPPVHIGKCLVSLSNLPKTFDRTTCLS